jgi:hypothetical protein
MYSIGVSTSDESSDSKPATHDMLGKDAHSHGPIEIKKAAASI